MVGRAFFFVLFLSPRANPLPPQNPHQSLGIQIGSVSYDRQPIADHAANLASTIQGNLARSLEAIGVDILKGVGKFVGPHTVKYSLPGRVDVGGEVKAKDVIIATGSVPFVPPGIPVDGKTVFTSDHALKLEWVPKWVAIIGSGYIGLEFSDVYTALGSEVTFIEAMDDLMPGFDREVARLAQRLLINPRKIDWHTGVLATKVRMMEERERKRGGKCFFVLVSTHPHPLPPLHPPFFSRSRPACPASSPSPSN